MRLHSVSRVENLAKKDDFEVKIGLLGLKNDQKQASLFTDQLRCKKYKWLILCWLEDFFEAKNDFHRGRGWGYAVLSVPIQVGLGNPEVFFSSLHCAPCKGNIRQ